MVPSEVLQRVYLIESSNRQFTGTAFTLDFEQRQYLISARHVIQPAPSARNVRLWFEGTWREVRVESIWAPVDPRIDVVVMPLVTALSTEMPLTFSSAGVAMGHEAYFLGYPYGRRSMGYTVMFDGHPFPFVKRATISGFEPDATGDTRFWLDANGNEGFSGGPLVFFNDLSREVCVAGVISHLETGSWPVMNSSGDETADWVQMTTGFVFAQNIRHALEGAKVCGNGVLLT